MKTNKKHIILSVLFMLLYNTLIITAQWTTQTSGTNNVLTSVYFISATTGYAAGNGGTILKTTNNGTTWTAQASGTAESISSINFKDPSSGYAVGPNGIFLKGWSYLDYWTPGSLGITWPMNSVCATGTYTCYVVGMGGKILKTNDGGQIWTTQTSGTVNELNSVFFIDANTGYIVGGDNTSIGIILKTTNGGTNWTAQTSGTNYMLRSVFFIDVNTGFAVGDGGTILKTTNGGTDWVPQASGTTRWLTSVYFIDANTGYVVGNSGTILKTIDGGANWMPQISGIPGNNLYSVFFTDANNGYAVGDKIVKTTNGGWCTGIPAKPSGEISICNPAGTSQYITTGASFATSYNWSLNPSTAGTISGTGTTATVTWSGTYNGYVDVIVQGVKTGCTGESSSLKVLVNNSSTFNISSPSNGAWTPETPLFQWGAATGALTYSLYIDGILKKDSIAATSYQVNPAGAISNGMHTWYIVSKNACTTQSNETWSILVDVTPPATFNLVSPADNSWTTSLQPDLSWSASSDANSGFAKYQLWIDGALNRDDIPVSATSTAPAGGLSNGIHSWMIKAIDNVGNVRNSTQTRTIRVDNLAPQVCSLLNPSDNQYLQTITPGFSWRNTTDSGIGFLKFQLFVDGNMIRDNLSDTSWTITEPLNYGQHNWYVNVIDSLGNTQSTGSRILYIDNARPDEFNLTSPTDSQIVNLPTPNLSWQATNDSTDGSGLSKYQLWINGIKNRDSIAVIQTTVTPGNTLTQGQYTWFIRAFDKVGNERQSAQTWSFFVDWEAPAAFNLLEPADNATSSVSRPLFIWHSSSDIGSGLERYELCISGQAPISILQPDTTELLNIDLPNNTYTWYIKAFDRSGTFTSSNIHTLIINDPLPNQAATPAGVNEFCINAVNTDFTTTGANNAGSYIWEINPSGAGTITGTGLTGSVDWNDTFTGAAQIIVKGHNSAGDGQASPALNVTVYAAAIAGSVSTGGNICSGTSTGTLTLSGHSGIILKWQKRLNSGSWSDIVNTTTTYTEIPDSIGVWEYRAEVQNGVCSSIFSGSATVTVTDIPLNGGIISGLMSICQGQNTINYTVPEITRATSYIWTLPEGTTGISLTNSINVDYGMSAVSGNITVKGQNFCGEGAISTLAITVNSSPANAGIITGNTSICQGKEAVNYTVPEINNATTYIWTLPTGATGTSLTSSINVDYGMTAVSGNITVKGHNTCGDGASSTLPITVNNKPATPVINLNGPVLHSNAATGNQWYNKSGLLIGSVNQDYTPLINNDYYVIVTLNGCSSEQSNTISITTVGIESAVSDKAVNIYPNPISDELIIEFKGMTNYTDFEILNSMGQVVFTGKLSEKTAVQTSTLSSGVYLLKLKNDKNIEFMKIVKE